MGKSEPTERNADSFFGLSEAEEDILFGTLEHEDGTKENITYKVFFDLVQRALIDENPDPDAIAKLEDILPALVEGIQENFNNLFIEDQDRKIAFANLNALRKLLDNLLQTAGIIEPTEGRNRLQEFWTGKREYMVVPRPKGIEKLLSINTTGDYGVQERKFDKLTIRFKGRNAIEEQKINDMFRIAFAELNPYRAKKGFDTLVAIPLDRTMEILGRPVNSNNMKMFSRKLVKEILPSISTTNLEFEGIGKKEKDYIIGKMYIGGGFFKVDVKNNKIYFRLSQEYAYYLSNGLFSQCNSKALLLGTRQNPLPYFVHQKMQDQYFHDGNRQRATNNLLSIKSILNFCADTLPSFEYVQKTDSGHWVRRIREPLEDALNKIQEEGLFSWEYCKKGLSPASEEETASPDYKVWSKLYITFALIPEEPDQTERLERKNKRIEAIQEQKALKDAETVIKADKIQRKNNRKKAQKENPQTEKAAPKK